jgi:hypothetical protein
MLWLSVIGRGAEVVSEHDQRKIALILAADVVSYHRLFWRR